MLRKDRETGRETALAVIDKCKYAVLAMTDAGSAPYCVPLSIARDGEAVYFHCAKAGKKADCLRKNPAVCLTCVGDVLSVEDRFSTKFESAIITGAACEVETEAEKIHALRLISRRYCSGYMHAFDDEIKKYLAAVSVWRVDILEITGKSNLK